MFFLPLHALFRKALSRTAHIRIGFTVLSFFPLSKAFHLNQTQTKLINILELSRIRKKKPYKRQKSKTKPEKSLSLRRFFESFNTKTTILAHNLIPK